MRAVDTNVLVRLMTRDDPKQVAAAEASVARGAWVSHVVLVEADRDRAKPGGTQRLQERGKRSNSAMQLTKLRAAPVLQAEVPPCAPAGRMDGGTASPLIRGVRPTMGASGGSGTIDGGSGGRA